MTVTLVAGGAGLLGAAVARRLAAEGGHVLVADFFGGAEGKREIRESRARELAGLANVTILRADLTSSMRLEPLLRRARPTAIVNAARFDSRGPGPGPLARTWAALGHGPFLHLSREGDGHGETLLRDSGCPCVVVRVPALAAGPASDVAPVAALSVEVAAQAVAGVLRRGSDREILVMGLDGSLERLPGDQAPAGGESSGRSTVSRRDLFGFFRKPLGRTGLPG